MKNQKAQSRLDKNGNYRIARFEMIHSSFWAALFENHEKHPVKIGEILVENGTAEMTEAKKNDYGTEEKRQGFCHHI